MLFSLASKWFDGHDNQMGGGGGGGNFEGKICLSEQDISSKMWFWKHLVVAGIVSI